MPKPACTTQPPDAVWTESDLRVDPHAAPDKAARVGKMFAAIARHYDLNNRVHSFGRDQAWRRRTVVLCGIQPSDDVLDVACGTGDLTLALAEAGPRSVTGLDFTEEMLEIAREKTTRHPEIPAPEYLRGDAMHLPFEDGSFDVLTIAFGIRNVVDPARALREFHRVLRVGGRLAVLEFSQPRHPVVRWLNRVYCGGVMPITASWIAGDRSGAYRYLPKSVATFPESQQFMDLLAGCGFARVESHPFTLGVCTAYVARLER